MVRSATLNLPHDPLLPRAPGGTRRGAAMAVVVHAGLLLALSVSVDWRTKNPDVVSAELWASVPQTAAPKPVAVQPSPLLPPPVSTPAPTPAPAPAPPAPKPDAVNETKPDIALERAKEQAAKKKTDAEAKAKEEAEKKRLQAEKQEEKKKQLAKQQEEAAAKADEARLAKQRDENLKRIMGQAESSKGAGAAAQDAAPSASYVGKLARRIRDENLVYTGTAPDNATVEITIRSAPGGTLLGREVIKRSGFPDWDDAVLRAIDKAGALPRDNDGRVPREITIAFRRRD